MRAEPNAQPEGRPRHRPLMLPQPSRNSRLRRRLETRFGNSPETFSSGVTSNVSARGLSIVARKVFAAGTRLQIEVTFPGEKVSKVGGIVCWSIKGIATLDMPGSMGIRLDAVDEGFFGLLAEEIEATRKRALAQTRPADGEASGGRTPPLPSSVGPPSNPRLLKQSRTEPRTWWTAPTAIPGPTAEGLASGKLVPPRSTPAVHVEPSNPERDAAEREYDARELKMATPQEWWQEPAKAPIAAETRPLVQRVPRFREQLPVRFGPTRALELQGATQDISRTGLSITCPFPAPPGDRVRFALTLADGQICHGSGSVAWTRLGKIDGVDGTTMGVRIERIQPSYRDLINSLSRRY